ncbi:MAG: 23S rRNA (guanosine(2251)-2'-O)-methyltransferase RlmB [Chitinophagales bacterium]
MCIGRQPVVEALSSGTAIEKIYMQRGSTGSSISEIQQMASTAGVPISYVPKEKLIKFTNLRHQGVIAVLSEIKYYHLEDIVDHCYSEGKDPLILVLDGVTDVGNFGAICRTALGLDVDAVVIGMTKSAPVNETAIKSSAGAIHHLKICRQRDLDQTIEYLKNYGISIVCLAAQGKTMIGETDFKGPMAVVMGDEGSGVSKSILQQADKVCKIPMNTLLESYNVSVATALVLYEVHRSRK